MSLIRTTFVGYTPASRFRPTDRRSGPVLGAASAHRDVPDLGIAKEHRHLAARLDPVAGVLEDEVLAVAVPVELPPPRDGTTTVVSQEPLAYSGTSADLVVRIAISPGQPGLNALTVDMASTQRPAPAAVVAVSVRLMKPGGAITLALRRISAERYYGSAQLPSVADLRVTVDVTRDGAVRTVPIATTSAATAILISRSRPPMHPRATAEARARRCSRWARPRHCMIH